MWNAIKKFFSFFFSVEEVNKVQTIVATEVDQKINQTLSNIEDLGKKIEEKIEEEVKKVEEEVKSTKRKIKEKLDVNKDGEVNVEDVKEVVKKATRKKK